MKITVERFTSDGDTTLSLVFIDGVFQCIGLEDEYRDDKIPQETRIPSGTYPVALRTVGGFHNRYKRKFSDIHHGMLHIQNVPNFEYILIHVGNTDDNTAGCLLVGTGAMCRKDDMSIQSSVEAYRALYQKVIDAAWAKELKIEFIDRDGQ